MRLLLISSEFPPGPGGIGNHAWHLACNLQKRGWDLVVLSPQDYVSDAAAADFNRSQPFPVARVPSGRGRFREFWARTRAARRLAKQHRAQVLVGTGLSGIWVAAAVSHLTRTRCMGIAHGSEVTLAGLTGAINRQAFHRMDGIVAVSRFTAGLVSKSGIRARHLEVVTNAADANQIAPLALPAVQEVRSRQGLNGAAILLTVGHVSERKGQEVVIRAMPEILKRVPEAHYFMIGLPTLQGTLTALAKSLGVENRVHFLGRVSDEDRMRWLSACDVFVMTSRTTRNGDCEGFGIAVVEAALCGKPAVVAGDSGLTEAIVDGKTGLAVPQNDCSATAAAVVRLLLNRNEREMMGQAARARALQEQTWDICGQKYDRLLRGLVDEH